jgi:hypothetical protein
MSIQLQDSTLKAKTGRGQWKVLTVIALYLILSVTVGVVRNEWQDPHAATTAVATPLRPG